MLLAAFIHIVRPLSATSVDDSGQAVETAQGPAAVLGTLIVTTSADRDDGVCDGNCSLREAIVAANNDAGADSISFNLSPSTTIVLSGTQLPAINDTLNGSTAVNLTVSGNSASRIMQINISAAVTVTAVTFADGNSLPGGGGAIFNLGSLTLSGGAIANPGGILTITLTTLKGNQALSGGGINNSMAGNLTLKDSILSGNVVSETGGGISSEGNSTVSVTDSTIDSNTANAGGGIYNEDGMTHLTNSTLSDNSAEYGGGIMNDSLIVNVSNSMITNNRAGTAGGGIASYSKGGTFTTITNTIVSGNLISGTTGADDLALRGGLTDSFYSGGYNLIGAIGNGISAFPGAGDLTGVTDPKLGPLVDNGGETFTHLLLSNSLALDGGDNSSCQLTDQRGEVRPKDGDGDGTARCDIGSVEMPAVQQSDWFLYLPMALK